VRGEFTDPYTYPGTDVLKNRLDIRDEALLSRFEYQQSHTRVLELRANPIAGKFDLKHLQAIHQHVFQDVFDWAGKLRTINISKGGTSFAVVDRLESYGGKISESLAAEKNLTGLDKVNFVARLAYYYGELNALHPFREGNGRATREFIADLAEKAGYELDQTRIDNNKGEWNLAAQRSFIGDLKPVTQVFMQSVRPSRAIAFEHLSEQDALGRHPELKGAYDGLHMMQKLFNEKYRNNPAAQQHYSASSKLEILRRLDTGVVLQPSVERNNVLIQQAAEKGHSVTTKAQDIDR
jgi:cell filamentation protein